MPLLGLILGKINLTDLKWVIKAATDNNGGNGSCIRQFHSKHHQLFSNRIYRISARKRINTFRNKHKKEEKQQSRRTGCRYCIADRNKRSPEEIKKLIILFVSEKQKNILVNQNQLQYNKNTDLRSVTMNWSEVTLYTSNDGIEPSAPF
jgi:hypothetical protein